MHLHCTQNLTGEGEIRIKHIASISRKGGVLPLHLAYQKRSLTEALIPLINVYPEGLKTKDKQKGQPPLHLACWYGWW